MTYFCYCSKKPSFPLENPTQQEILKSCKICGGRLPVDGRGAQQGSMLSNGGLKLSGVIDPHLSWKTAANGRQRAVRRARTSFTGAFTMVSSKSSRAKTLKVRKDLTEQDSKDQDSNGAEDIPVSESEKVGVSILGRRFSDTLGSVPIKKRRFLFPNSPSPTCHSSSYSDDSGHIRERKTASNQGAVSKHQSFDMNSISGSVPSQKRNSGFKKTNLKGVNEKVCDAADFSGISILAAAACDSNIEAEFMNLELSKEPSSEVQGVDIDNAKIDFLQHDKEEAGTRAPVGLVGITVLPFQLSSLSPVPGNVPKGVSTGSSDLATSLNSSQNALKTTRSTSREVRFDWDLNTVADAWEGDEASMYSDGVVTSNANEDGDQKETVPIMETSADQAGYAYTKNAPTGDSHIVDIMEHLAGRQKEASHASEVKTEEKPDISTDKADSNCSFGDFPFTSKGDAVASESLVPDSSLSSNDVFSDGRAESAKAEAHFVVCYPNVKTEDLSSCPVSCDNTILGHPLDISGLNPGTDRKQFDSRNVQKVESSHIGCPKVEKNELACVSSVTINELASGSLLVCCPSGKYTEVPAYLNDKNSKEKDGYGYETEAAEMKMDHTEARNDDMDVSRNVFPTDIGFKVFDGKSVGITSGNIDASPPLSSQGDFDCASNPAQVAAESHLDKQCYADSSQNIRDQEPGMEKVEFLGDDDSQYEDGEFRESLENYYLDDGEEGETEHVDCWSDKDTDFCDAASVFSSVSRPVKNMALSNASLGIHHQEVGKDAQNNSWSFMNRFSLANVLDTGLGKNNAGSAMVKSSHGNRTTSNDMGDNGFLQDADDARRSNHSASFRKMSGWDRLPGGYRGSGNRVADSRSDFIARNHTDASSGPSWDCDSMNRARCVSPRIGRIRSDDRLHRNEKAYGRLSRSDDRNGFSFNPRADRDRDDFWSVGRGGQSHMQGRGKSDHRVDSSYHGNNQHDSSGYYGSSSFSRHGTRNAAAAAVAKVESNGFVVAPDGTIVKAGSPGAAVHLTRRSVKGSSQNTRHSPVGRRSPVERERSFGRPSGPCRSREMSLDMPKFIGRGKRDRYGPQIDGASHRERRRHMPDVIIDSASMHQTVSRRDHSFSPSCRSPSRLSRSRSRSPSRSRTRSPHRWASPRGRSDNGMNGSAGFRKRSRSPIYRSDVRMERPRAGFVDRIVSHSSLPRNHTSPHHASRWINGRKEASEHFRDYEYRRRPERSPPARVLSQGRRFDLMDFPGRLKTDEYCRPTNSGRLSEFVGLGRGSRHDGKGDDIKDHGDRYDTRHSARRFVKDGNMKRLPYNDELGINPLNLRAKSSDFLRRESSRAFDRRTDRQLGVSPVRSEEGKSHLRNGDGNHSANCKSFDVPDGDENMDAQRRPND